MARATSSAVEGRMDLSLLYAGEESTCSRQQCRGISADQLALFSFPTPSCPMEPRPVAAQGLHRQQALMLSALRMAQEAAQPVQAVLAAMFTSA